MNIKVAIFATLLAGASGGCVMKANTTYFNKGSVQLVGIMNGAKPGRPLKYISMTISMENQSNATVIKNVGIELKSGVVIPLSSIDVDLIEQYGTAQKSQLFIGGNPIECDIYNIGSYQFVVTDAKLIRFSMAEGIQPPSAVWDLSTNTKYYFPLVQSEAEALFGKPDSQINRLIL